MLAAAPGANACTHADKMVDAAATYVSFASIVYPSIKTVLAGPATVDVLNGIANGTCVGGMLNEVELRYAFGPGA